MEKYVYNYDEWLSGHTKRKTMMEKLERSYDSGSTRILSARTWMMNHLK